ncbi:MAG: VWA domain-containing protein [Spirochaetaceae bacterium]|jgi:hypothetical protein|nr:VWA domain-containing protein [Spirochaetaceae bacterium]
MVSRIYKEGKQISAKKVFLLVLLLCWPFFFVVGQEKPLDLILILDTSSSMSGSYQKTLDYVTGNFLKEFLRMGDTFHLISFSDTPRLEITRRIAGRGDVETVIGRLFLLYPLDPYSDISEALAYGERYAASIPGTRGKKVVLISDGDHSPQQGGTEEGSIQNLISQTTARLNRAGIDFYYVPVPVVGNGPSSGRSRMLPIPNRPAAQPAVPPASPRQTPQAQTPVPPAGPTTAQTARPETGPVQTQRPVPPAEQTPEPRQPEAEKPSPEIPAVSPSPKVTDKESSPGKARYQAGDISLFGLPLAWFTGGIFGVILILAFIIFLMIKRLQTSPNRTFAHAAGASPEKPIPAGKPEVSKDDRVPQNKNLFAAYPAVPYQNELKKPGASLEAALPEKKSTAPAESLPKTEDRATPISYPGPRDRQDKGGADMTGGPIKNPETSPGAALPEKKLTAPAESLPKTEDRATPISYPGPRDRQDKGEANTVPGGSISSGGPRKIFPVNSNSYKSNTQTDKGPLMLSLFVEDQNTNIGRRNIHAIKSGYSFTIGGGKSDFLIFLVPIPPRIAELRSNGAQCTFIPRKPEFFPDIGSQPVPNCVGIPIRIISERQYELFIRIDRYEDPLIALNRLLHSVDVPGYW